MTIQLVHPTHGICAQEVISPYKNVDKISRQWASRYGDKFFECEIKLVTDIMKRPAAIYSNDPHSHK